MTVTAARETGPRKPQAFFMQYVRAERQVPCRQPPGLSLAPGSIVWGGVSRHAFANSQYLYRQLYTYLVTQAASL